MDYRCNKPILCRRMVSKHNGGLRHNYARETEALGVTKLCAYKMKLWTSSRYNRKRVLSMAIKGQYPQCIPKTWRDQTHAIPWTSTEDSPKPRHVPLRDNNQEGRKHCRAKSEPSSNLPVKTNPETHLGSPLVLEWSAACCGKPPRS